MTAPLGARSRPAPGEAPARAGSATPSRSRPVGVVARQPERRRLGARLAHAAARHPRWLEWLTRVGYVARGVVYLVIGGTGVLLAFGLAERGRGSSDVMRLVVRLPLGRVFLAALTIGLVGYAVLSLVAAVRAPEEAGAGRGRGAALVVRASDAVAGVVYAGLAALAVRLLADPLYDTGFASELWAARLLARPWGRLLMGGAGALTAAAALALVYKAAALPLATQLERRGVPPVVVRAIARLARAGVAARAVLFALCGWLLLHAAWTGEPSRVGGLGQALDALSDAPAGPGLVGVVAVGCVAYGLYQLAKARYRRLRLGGAADRRAGVAP